MSTSVVFDTPERLTEGDPWRWHIPFAFWCVEQLRPRVLVEVGTHRGDSYLAFCQAVKRLRLDTSCYGVGTWEGGEEAGSGGEAVLEELRAQHDPRYAAFSRLVQGTDAESAQRLGDGTVDLLHLEGRHGLGVQAAYQAWRQKLSRRAVVLVHGVDPEEGDRETVRFWEELRAGLPHFTFPQGGGLGVLQAGPEAAEGLRPLLEGGAGTGPGAIAFFSCLGSQLAAMARLQAGERAALQERVERRRLGHVIEHLAARAEELRERERLLRQEHQREVDGLLAEIDRARTVGPTPLGWGLASLARLPHRLWHAASVAGDLLSWAARLRLREGLRLRRDERLVRRAWLLDPEHYLRQCGDNPKARRNPIRHYLRHGAARGLDPNPYFDTSWYVERYRPVTDLGLNPLIHYLRHGARLALDPGPRFDTASYLSRCPGAAASGLTPLSHFLMHGRRAGFSCARPAAVEEAARFLPAAVPGGARQAHHARNRVLVVDHRMLTPDQDSGSVRMSALIRLLRDLGHEVTFVAGYDFGGPGYREALSRHAGVILIGQEATEAHLMEEGGSYRFAVLSRPELFERYRPVVRALAPQAKVIYDTVDLHWVRLTRAAEVSGDRTLLEESQRFRNLERACVAGSDLTLAITDQERSTILGEVPDAEVVVVPNIHAVQARIKPLAGRRDLFFIGGYGHPPNADAVRWFAGEILPRIRERLPEVLFHVVGADPPDDVERLAGEGIRVAGWVPDATRYFEGCRVFVSPLRYGAGMKGKIGQAMSFGLPVVTTSIGAEGMQLVHGENALVADEPAAFAEAVVSLYGSPTLWASLSEASLRHVQRHFSEGAVRQTLAAVFPVEREVPRRWTGAVAEPPA